MSTTDITPFADDALSPDSGPSSVPARKPRPNHQRHSRFSSGCRPKRNSLKSSNSTSEHWG